MNENMNPKAKWKAQHRLSRITPKIERWRRWGAKMKMLRDIHATIGHAKTFEGTFA